MDDARARQSIDRILRVFEIIMNEWARSNSFSYSLRAERPVVGRHLNEIRDVPLWLGVGGKGERVSLVEVVCVFQLLASQSEQLPYAKHLKDVKVRSQINLEPTELEIVSVLRQLHV